VYIHDSLRTRFFFKKKKRVLSRDLLYKNEWLKKLYKIGFFLSLSPPLFKHAKSNINKNNMLAKVSLYHMKRLYSNASCCRQYRHWKSIGMMARQFTRSISLPMALATLLLVQTPLSEWVVFFFDFFFIFFSSHLFSIDLEFTKETHSYSENRKSTNKQ
jgi:hypothetical protein